MRRLSSTLGLCCGHVRQRKFTDQSYLSSDAFKRIGQEIKTNIMPLNKSILLFYREAFPTSYKFAGCALIWQQLKSPVKVKYKRLVIAYTRPLSTIAIITEEHFCFLAFSRIVLFPPPPWSPSRRLTKYPM